MEETGRKWTEAAKKISHMEWKNEMTDRSPNISDVFKIIRFIKAENKGTEKASDVSGKY